MPQVSVRAIKVNSAYHLPDVTPIELFTVECDIAATAFKLPSDNVMPAGLNKGFNTA